MGELKMGFQKLHLNSVSHSVRAAQAVLQYGVGAMVDFPEQTLMTATPYTWGKVNKIHDERLERMLRVDYIGMPKGKDVDFSGISYCRFPEWYSCPSCGKLSPLNDWIKKANDNNPKRADKDPFMYKRLLCIGSKSTDEEDTDKGDTRKSKHKKNVDLIPARLVTVCACGHIDDFPWVKWVHARNFQGSKPICNDPQLKLNTGQSGSDGLEGIIVYCLTCKASASLKGAFTQSTFKDLDKQTGGVYDFRCTGRHPWKKEQSKCAEYPVTLQRGSSSVYFPVVISSLVIPPFSSRLTGLIQNSDAYAKMDNVLADRLEDAETPSEKEDIIRKTLEKYAGKIALEIGRDATAVKPILERIKSKQDLPDYDPTKENYRLEEYRVLAGNVDTDYRDDFVKEVVDINDYNIPYVKGISLIHKVREVQALIGFTRIEPVGSEYMGDKGNSSVVNIKSTDMNWYPGYELRGEGIFIEFDNDAIEKWISTNEEIKRRVEVLEKNYKKTYWGGKNPRVITEKFLLLHTLSHLLLKQLSFECGYSIASLKERIYSCDNIDGETMSGILVYTASGDSEGTMGGLVRQGQPDLFPAIFTKAIKSAIKCSNDPVCSLSQGQGRDSLNLAACYSCTLVPETSCEEYNVFLDRGVVVGTLDHPNIGFYSKEVYGNTFVADQHKTKGKIKTKKVTSIDITDLGVDLTDESYKNIWAGLKEYANECEIPLIDDLITNVERFRGIAKPHRAATFFEKGKKQALEADLIWPEKRVMLFTSENEDEYNVAVNSQWKCFYTADSKLSWDKILKALK